MKEGGTGRQKLQNFWFLGQLIADQKLHKMPKNQPAKSIERVDMMVFSLFGLAKSILLSYLLSKLTKGLKVII